MRVFLAAVLVLFATTSVTAQTFEYSQAPREALGFAFGTPLAEVTKALTSSGLAYREEPPSVRTGVAKVVLTGQVLGELKGFTVELSFVQGTLFQVSASVAYAPEAQKALLSVLQGKYGTVRSQDGGFHHNWFFTATGKETPGVLPDFAISLANDPVTKKTIVLTYVDNRRKAGGLAPVPAEDLVPQLNSSQF